MNAVKGMGFISWMGMPEEVFQQKVRVFCAKDGVGLFPTSEIFPTTIPWVQGGRSIQITMKV
jgi:hypothetical protein